MGELEKVFTTLHPWMHNPFKVVDSKFKARVERHLSEYDTNADGVLSFDEFKQLYNVLQAIHDNSVAGTPG